MSPDAPARRRLGGQFSWIAAGRVLSALLQAVALILLVRAAQPADFGLVAAALGIVTVAQSGLDLGLPTLAARERARLYDSPVVAAALNINRITSFALLAILAAIGMVLSLNQPLFLLLLPLSVSAAFERIADARLGVAVADGDARHNFIGMVGRRLIAVLILVFGLWWGQIDAILIFSLGSAVGAVFSALYAACVVSVVRLAPLPPLQNTLRSARSFWINSLALQARNLDATFVTVIAGGVQGAFYGLSSRLGVPLRLPATSMGAALLPAAARARTFRARLGNLRVAVPVWAGCVLFYVAGIPLLPAVLPHIAGPGYEGAVPVLQVTFAGLCAAAFASLATPVLQGWGQQKFVAVVSTVAMVACLAGVSVGAAFGGAFGAAIGWSASFVVQSGLLCTGVVRGLRSSDPEERVDG